MATRPSIPSPAITATHRPTSWSRARPTSANRSSRWISSAIAKRTGKRRGTAYAPVLREDGGSRQAAQTGRDRGDGRKPRPDRGRARGAWGRGEPREERGAARREGSRAGRADGLGPDRVPRGSRGVLPPAHPLHSAPERGRHDRGRGWAGPDRRQVVRPHRVRQQGHGRGGAGRGGAPKTWGPRPWPG